MIRNLTPDDLQHLRYAIALLRSEHRNELADRLLDFVENRMTDRRQILALHMESYFMERDMSRRGSL